MRANREYDGRRSESEVLRCVLDGLALYGIEPRRRNTGGMYNAAGQYVAFGEPGTPDLDTTLPAGFGAAAGRRLEIEVKRERFDPGRLRGAARARFDRQVARLKRTCADGGYGFWIDDAYHVVWALGRIRDGCRIGWVGDWWHLINPED